MNSITSEWKRDSSDEVHFPPKRQYFREDSIGKINNSIKRSTKKKVRFNCQTSITTEQQSVEYTKNNHADINQSEKLIFNDHNYPLSSASTNILTTKLSAIYDQPISSVPTAVITFFIFIFIFIAAAIVLGIIYSIIKSSRNTTVTSIKTTNRNAFLTTFTTMMANSVIIRNKNGAPCLSYTTINDPTRNVAQSGLSDSCDNGPLFNISNGGTWIRFVGSGGTIIPLSSPGRNHCGADAAGWFTGTLPTTFDSIVHGFVCFANDVSECFISLKSSVIYCIGNFYVYFLSPVSFCNARYCTI
ncbi:unnamed protein product [Rotaria sp. Silwood1]|nr:unnamed protein product [Rotaria sp. Silwood1]CAF4543972.1 unnamed protein product [Rotaria sp. Silwood1]CAF4907722.1 unnamed protein product [Rotaria sp. Silwood1]